MTEEEREAVQEQLKALNQAYSDLSQHCSDHTAAAEEVGRLIVSSVQYLPVFVSRIMSEESASLCSAA